MDITHTDIDGVRIVGLNTHRDDRGSFTRVFCAHTFRALGLPHDLVQWNLSENPTQGTLRGLHWQTETAPEDKLVQCISGAIWDVAVDMRIGSPTYGRHVGIHLKAGAAQALQIPSGCAHGFVTLASNSTVLYGASGAYDPKAERGARWNDVALGIEWPCAPTVISDKDASWADIAL